jgi:protein SCO1/2
LLSRGEHYYATLPYYGFKTALGPGDTLYHEIPEWEFTNQEGKLVGQQAYDGKIYVANFIFTTCPTICPKMTTQMSLLQYKLDDPAFDVVKMVSYSVNPEYDTPEILKAYGKANEADFNRWSFYTGDKQAIYELGVKGYLVSAQEDVLAPGGFLHSEKFILVDWNRNIRGYYDGTDVNDVSRLEDDIKILLKEKARNEPEV